MDSITVTVPQPHEEVVVTLTSPTQVDVAQPTPVTVVGSASVGPQGPPGPPGPPGSAPQAFTHTQATPAASVPITHNLGYFPNVTAVDLDSGQVIDTDIAYSSVNALTITFGSPRRFVAYLS